MRRSRIVFFAMLSVMSFSGAGCSHYSTTRIFFEGETVDAEDRPISGAVVRIQTREGSFETLSDSTGHYRFEFLERCLTGGIGGHGALTSFVEAFEKEKKLYAKSEFDLETVMLVGLSKCPRDAKKYLRIGLSRVE